MHPLPPLLSTAKRKPSLTSPSPSPSHHYHHDHRHPKHPLERNHNPSLAAAHTWPLNRIRQTHARPGNYPAKTKNRHTLLQCKYSSAQFPHRWNCLMSLLPSSSAGLFALLKWFGAVSLRPTPFCGEGGCQLLHGGSLAGMLGLAWDEMGWDGILGWELHGDRRTDGYM
ncbi:hypothetical protein P167DRAFT_383400 [Morchella conica CCBAS932]|uniref:Uncharacterized protein n=1 Tax=Morchella conica CCBAS932 TaxID=1392247 RepID=A0A3N4L312_9PEZI|nr:hypothetical protein P167DRAFT_383400 [Morchella conica CCBAS932]